MLKRQEVEALASSVRRLLESIRVGQIDAKQPTTLLLAGALAALEAVLGERSALLDDLTKDDPS